MQPRTLTRSADRIVSSIAVGQHGVVERGQLLAAGVTPQEIATRLKDGRLHQIHRGVYLVGPVAAEHAHEMAALLACGPQSVLSHRNAAALWSLFPYPATAPVWVTVRPGRSARRPGLKIVRTQLEARDIRRREAIRLTSPPRTLLDLAGVLGAADLEQAIAEAHYRHLASERELRSQLERNPGKRGAGQLRDILDLPGGPQRTRSPAERIMLRLLRETGITGFESNARIHGYEVDFLWRTLDFAVEVDGYDGHSGRFAFERDRAKWATLQAHGVQVMPVTGRQLLRDPEGVVTRLISALEQAGYLGI